MTRNFLNRPLAITDIETSGLDAQLHEILEIGLLVVDQKTLKVLDEWEMKIKPVKLKHAAQKALQVAGYTPEDWKYSSNLATAMDIYSGKTKDAVLFAHNTFFVSSFLTEAFKRAGADDLTDYHRADLFSIAWSRRHKLPGLKEFNLENLCDHLRVAREPVPHRALAGAHTTLTVLRKLLTI